MSETKFTPGPWHASNELTSYDEPYITVLEGKRQ